MTQEWKVALNGEGKVYLLFDRANDPHESQNVAGLSEYKPVEESLRLDILERIATSQLKAP